MSGRATASRVGAAGGLVHAALAAASALVLAPLLWLLAASLKRNEDFFTSPFLPAGDGPLSVAWDRLTLEHFARLFTSLGIGGSLANSAFLSATTALLATLLAAMGGYALAVYSFRGRRAVSAIVLGAVLIPVPLLLAPGYQLLFRLGLLDTFTGLILPAITPAFGVYLFKRTAPSSVPASLIEAARLDGAGEGRIFFGVALPLMRPMVGTFLLITFVATWNNFLQPQVVLQSPEKFPLSVTVANLRGVFYQDYGLQMAGTVVGILPVMALFLLLQREFVSGLITGSVKG